MNANLAENFCGHCGEHLSPRPGVHVSLSCSTCGKTKYLAKPGEGGKGIQIEMGDRVTFPSVDISFDPAICSGRLTRDGVPFLLKQFFVNGMPERAEVFVDKLKALRKSWDQELQASDKFAGIDMSSPTSGDDAFERLNGESDSHELHMLVRDLNASLALTAVEEGDALRAAHHALHTGLAHGLTVVSEPYFEGMVWHGYLAGIAVHQCNAAADQVPGEVEALAELDPLFRKVGKATLRTWLESGSTIGIRIGVSSIPEKLLVARATWHLDEFSRLRAEQAKQPAETRALGGSSG